MTQPGSNAYTILEEMLTRWGLQSLAPEALRMLQDGYTDAQIPVLLQDTEPYKKRFRGNEARRKNGMPVLSPEEYLQTERSYGQVMANAGLPKGFYDDPDDFAGWIGNDVAPVEVQRRVGEAVDATSKIDANTQRAFLDLYGLQQGELTAFVLDAQRGRDVINKVIHGGRIAGAAKGYDVNLSKEQAERFGAMSSDDYVKQSQDFGRLAGVGEHLSNLYEGEDYGAEEAAQEVFGNNTDAERKRKKLLAREEGEFSGRGGVASAKSLSNAPGGY